MRRLPDRLCPEPRILFVGINPSLRSAALGHHFAGRGNPFWRLLYAARLVPVPLNFAEDRRALDFGLGLTNIVARPTRAASELERDEYERGRRRLAGTIAGLRPRVVAFVGATAYRGFFGAQATAGCGAKPERIAGARVFVLPNPSGRNAAYPGFRHKLCWYQRLARYAYDLDAQADYNRGPGARQ